jgi:sugar/nucleoside kinase (ribokinase family)
MIRQCELLYEQLLQLLELCKKQNVTTDRYIQCGFLATQNILTQLQQLTENHIFVDEDEEIRYFKYILPKFRGWEEFHALVYTGESLAGSSNDPIQSWQDEQELTEKYFIKYQSLYDYFVNDKNDLDRIYFLKKNNLLLQEYSGKQVVTTHSALFAKFTGRKKYLEYIAGKLKGDINDAAEDR